MLSPRTIVRRARRAVAFDERSGDVCTRACRAASRRNRDLDRALTRRGPH